MKKIFLPFLFLQNLILIAQTPSFTWSETQSPINNELNYSIQDYIDGKRIFKVKSIYNEKIFNKDIVVDIFSLNDDFEKDESDFSIGVDQPIMGKNMQTVNQLFYLNNKDYVS